MDVDELLDRLEMTGSAVESVQKMKSAFEGVKIGMVKSMAPHPSADRLRICSVDVGSGKDLTIVCGAPNVDKGQKVPVVTVGGKLPGGVEIKQANLRGVVSQGMIASESELGLGEDASGIMVLAEDFEIGSDLDEILELDDVVVDFEITPNRPDCMSMIGMAREVAVITGGEVKTPDIRIEEKEPASGTRASVEIKDSDLCPRYSARVVAGVKVDRSPLWMRIRLNKSGIRPINNLVDITNYVLVETGQPLHAFDLAILEGQKIIVRRAAGQESIETLDGIERSLSPDMLVIADTARPVAIAGIMGGADTEISEKTTECLIESAYFKPSNICRTSYALDLRSEASSRFERGIDYGRTLRAADRAAQLMQEIAGGSVLKGSIDEYPKPIRQRTISLRTDRVNRILGTNVGKQDVKKYLTSIEFEVQDEKDLRVKVPTFRPDVEREIDLIEEVARLYGFERIESTLPRTGGRHGGLEPSQKAAQRVRDTLVYTGLQEVITYAFIDPSDIDRLSMGPDVTGEIMTLRNPLSAEQSVLRPSLIPGLLKVLRFNASYGNENIHIFEIGRTFKGIKGETLPEEHLTASGLMWGAWEKEEWYKEASRKMDFFDAKGVMQAVMERLRIRDWTIKQGDMGWLHPGQSAVIVAGGDKIGYMGRMHPSAVSRYEIEGDVFVFEFAVDALVDKIAGEITVEAPSRYPSIIEDVAFVVEKSVSAEDIQSVIVGAGGKTLKQADLFDEYEGDHIPKDKKSMAYHLVFQSDDRTLTDKEALRGKDTVVKAVSDKLNAEIRK